MAFLYNAGQLGTIITKLAEMDVGDLGEGQANQNTFIYFYINMAMMEMAEVANNVKYSDALAMSADGYKTFLQGNVAIADMYSPLDIYDANNTRMQPRTSDDGPKGWWREANNTDIHVRGFSLTTNPLAATNYVLKYIKYPARVTLDSDVIEFPPAGYNALVKKVVSLIKYSKNSYGGAEFVNNQANESMVEALKSTEKARGG